MVTCVSDNTITRKVVLRFGELNIRVREKLKKKKLREKLNSNCS